MFIKKSFADEIATSMERQLVDEAINKRAAQEERLVKAANYLNAAAEIFDESGLGVQAELITAVLESLAAKKSKKKKIKSKAKAKKVAPKKAPSSEKMVENLKQKGWVFDESDAFDKHCADDNCAMCGDMSYAKDSDDDAMNDEELLSMLDDFRNKSEGADFEDEIDLRNPDTISDERLHPDFKMPEFKFEDPEYSADVYEPRDPIYNQHRDRARHTSWNDMQGVPKYKDMDADYNPYYDIEED